MDDNLDQLLSNLKLHKLRQILPDEVKKAMKAKASYEDLLVTLFRAQYQDQSERSIQSRIRHARVPEKWSLATFPFDRQPDSVAQSGTWEPPRCRPPSEPCCGLHPALVKQPHLPGRYLSVRPRLVQAQ